MQQVNPEAATASDGEISYILQLRPATPPEADGEALTRQIDQFVGLYLAAAGADEARFAVLEPLTWAISAPPAAAETVEEIRTDLAETLFACSDGDHVRLVRQNDPPVQDGSAADPADELFGDWEPAHSSAATRAAMDDSSDVLDLDAPDLDIVDRDVFEVDAWTPDSVVALKPSDPEILSAAPDEADDASLEALTEIPDRPAPAGSGDVAAELAAFRAEMREIAAGIPSGSGVDALDAFRSELDAVTGALGQRVDGAAQRIETAAEQVAETVAGFADADRMADAVERAEASAQLMESSVRDAAEALTAALKAMSRYDADPEDRAEAGG